MDPLLAGANEVKKVRRILWLIFGAILLQMGFEHTPFARTNVGAVAALGCLYTGFITLIVAGIRIAVASWAGSSGAPRKQGTNREDDGEGGDR